MMFAICSRMRFILRSQANQSKIEEKPSITCDPEDYAVIIDGPVVGRIYPNPIDQTKWNWVLQSPVGRSRLRRHAGRGREHLKQRWCTETRKLSQR
jgi:hypothetical protein